MTEEKIDQVSGEIGKEEVKTETKPDESTEKQSEETEKEPTIKEVEELAKALQKGYTQTRQDISELKGSLQDIADKMNTTSGATQGDEEYVTVGKLKQVLSEVEQNKVQQQEANQMAAKTYVDNTITQLKAEGIVKSDTEAEEFAGLALEMQEQDLSKVAKVYQKIQQERGKVAIEASKTKARQEEGSKIGTSSKTATGESSGIDYKKVKETDWTQF